MDTNEHTRGHTSRHPSDTASSETIGYGICSATTALHSITIDDATLPIAILIPNEPPTKQRRVHSSDANCSSGHASSFDTACVTTFRLRPTYSTSPTTGFSDHPKPPTTDAADGKEHPGTISSIGSPNTLNRSIQPEPATRHVSLHTIDAGVRVQL